MSRNRKSKKLPSRPSRLIALALEDLELSENDPKMSIDMDDWFIPADIECYQPTCQVCLAGAVMAKSLNVSLDEHCDLEDFDDETENTLRALDSFREGYIERAFDYLNVDLDEDTHRATTMRSVLEEDDYGDFMLDFDVTDYERSPTKFKKEMWELALTLEFIGY